MKRQWYAFTAKTETPEVAELLIYDEIGASFWNDDAVTAKDFIGDLAAIPETVTKLKVRVNSPGGDPFDATAIANAMRAWGRDKGRTVEVSIEGLAASAASIITCAGDSILMADNALLMVHNPWSIEMGDAKAFRAAAEALDRIRDSIVTTYQWVSGLSTEAIQSLMDAETWMTASTAVEQGFATEIVAGVKAAASFRPGAIKLEAVPEAYRARVAEFLAKKPAPVQEPPKDVADPAAIIRACKAAGFPELAEDLLNQPMAAVEVSLAERKTAKVGAEARATEIRALCAASKLPDLADDYIAGGMALAQVKAQLLRVKATLAAAEIDGTLPAGEGTRRASSTLSVTDIYRERNTPRTTKGVTP